MCGVQPGQRAERPVGGAVVDEDDLPGLAERVERRLPARRGGARRCAPRRARGRSPRSRPLAYVPDAPVALHRRRPRARARPGPAARRGARPVAAAAGRVLAEDVVARVDLPPFASSAMDGFAVRAADLPGRLPIVFRIAAGLPADRPLAPGEAMEISTGGAVPEGADAVVPIEHVVEQDNEIEVADPVAVRSARPSGRRRRPRRRRPARGRHVARRRAGRRARSGRSRRGCCAPGGPPSSSSARARSCARRETSSGPVRSTSRTGRCSPRRSKLRARSSSGSARSPTTRSRTATRSSAGSPRTCSSARAASRSARTISCAGSSPSWASRRTSGAWPFGRASRSLSAAAARRSSSACPGNPVSSLVAVELFVRPALLALQGAAQAWPALRVGAARVGAAAERSARRARPGTDAGRSG